VSRSAGAAGSQIPCDPDLDSARREILEEFADAYNRHDHGAIMGFMTDDCEFVSYFGPDPWGERFVGRTAVTDRVVAGLASFPDARWLDCVHSVAGDRAFSEWTFVATNLDGTRVRRDGIDVFVFRGTKIASKSTFQKWVVTDREAH
jgi:ketosteroid isomerase-like protein